MTIDSIGLLASLLRYAGRKVAAHQFAAADELAPLIKAGWLVPAGVPETLLCEVCDDPHTVDVVHFHDKPRGVCRRTADTFPISRLSSLHRVDGAAFARSLARALHLDGDTSVLRGFDIAWKLGARTLNDTRVVFFFTPSLDRIDASTTILDSIAGHSRAMTFCLLVASSIDKVRLPTRHNVVTRVGDIVAIEPDGHLTVDEAQLLIEVFPGAGRPRARGRPPRQRDLILPLLHELEREGVAIDDSHETCRVVQGRFQKSYPGAKIPVANTMKSAIFAWLSRNSRELTSRCVMRLA